MTATREPAIPGRCDCAAEQNGSSFHAVWCEVYSNRAREKMVDLREGELLDIRVRTLAEFKKSNVCKRCREEIRTPEEALLVELGSEETYLIHATLDCYSSEVEALIDRYMPAEETKAVA